MITSRIPDKITAAGINKFTRKHWGIENKSHYVRDTVYREDHSRRPNPRLQVHDRIAQGPSHSATSDWPCIGGEPVVLSPPKEARA